MSRPDPELTVLITGASSGIGLELARIFAAEKYRLVLSARSVEPMEKLAAEFRATGVEVDVIPADLANADEPKRLFDEIIQRGITIDILVNNAGFGTHGKFWEIDPAQELALLQVNVVSLVHLTRLFLPGMVERRRGKILNVASTAGFQPGPLMANYYASKAYVVSFSEAIANELRGKGVTVTALCPGPTVTNFQKRAGIENSALFQVAGLSAEAVALAGYDAMMRGKRICIPGMKNRLLATLGKLVPKPLLLATVRKLNESR
jgi:uncharacterized protein